MDETEMDMTGPMTTIYGNLEAEPMAVMEFDDLGPMTTAHGNSGAV